MCGTHGCKCLRALNAFWQWSTAGHGAERSCRLCCHLASWTVVRARGLMKFPGNLSGENCCSLFHFFYSVSFPHTGMAWVKLYFVLINAIICSTSTPQETLKIKLIVCRRLQVSCLTVTGWAETKHVVGKEKEVLKWKEKQNPYFNHLLREDGELEGQDEGYITSLEAREESVGCYKRIPRCWVSLSVSLSSENHTQTTHSVVIST